MPRYRAVNLPKDIEGCHELIHILIAELNEWSEMVCEDESNPIDRDYYTPPPAGINGGSEMDAKVTDNMSKWHGGVTFKTPSPLGVIVAPDKIFNTENRILTQPEGVNGAFGGISEGCAGFLNECK